MGNTADCECSHQGQMGQGVQAITLQKQLENYAIANKINRIPRPKRIFIQLCFTLRQKHISDRMIELYNRNKGQQNELFESLKEVDLEYIDELYYATKFQNFGTFKNEKYISIKKIGSLSKKNPREGQIVIKDAKIMFIACVDCFQFPDAFKKTDLTSGKTPLQIFVEKIEAFNAKYQKSAKVYVICTKKNEKRVIEAMKNSATVIPYKSNIPVILEDGKIVLSGNKLKFHQKMGDFIQFMRGNTDIKKSLSESTYINFCDLSNLISPLVDPNAISYLQKYPKYQILVSIKTDSQMKFSFENSFLEFSEEQKNTMGDCLMKSSLIVEMKDKHFNKYQIFGSRIKKEKCSPTSNEYIFKRTISDIFYNPTTLICRASSWASNSKEYSNFCKEQIGIENQCEQDLVEISVDILRGEKERLQEIRRALMKNEQEIGFPLLIFQKQQQ